ncbi:hypothetical protein [Streptomyces albospinus]|nr:hypothetical protein [Streptomyces albospinus]
MPPATDFPDFRRPDAATVLVSAWLVPDAGSQRPAADAVLAGWERWRRPDAMLALSAFLSTDGGHVLNYAPSVARYRLHGTVVNVPSPRPR